MENKEPNEEENSWLNFLNKTLEAIQNTAEGVQSLLQKLAEDQKITWEEGKKLYDDFMQNTQVKKQELEGQMSKISQKIIENMPFATKEELKKLEKRIEELENNYIKNS